MGLIERNQKVTAVKKDEIIDGIEKALQSKSYDKLTIDDIAKEAEYSKKTIYSYFRSKNEIYLELLIRKFNLLNDALQNAIANSDQKGVEKIKVLANAYYQFSKEFPEYMQAIINFETKQVADAPEEDKLKERFNQDTEKSFLLLMDAIKESIERNEIHLESDVVSTAILLWSNINGFIILDYKKGDFISSSYGKSLDELFDCNLKMMLRSLKQPK